MTHWHRRNIINVLTLEFSDKLYTNFSVLLQSHVRQNVQILLSSWVVKFTFRNQNRSRIFAEEQTILSLRGTEIPFIYHLVRCQIAVSAEVTRFFVRQHWKYVLISA